MTHSKGGTLNALFKPILGEAISERGSPIQPESPKMAKNTPFCPGEPLSGHISALPPTREYFKNIEN
jgi:hypothetical protein